MNTDLFLKYTKQFHINLDDTAIERFSVLLNFLLFKNTFINLTAIKEADEVVVKHFADSLSFFIASAPKIGDSIIDIGTGAGFPGLPILIAIPDLSLTMLDSTRKKLGFINEALEKLNLKAETLHMRAEEAGINADYREKYDYAVSRAVSYLPALCEYCLPFVKVGGSFVAFKGAKAEQEITDAKGAIKLLGGDIENVFTFELGDSGERSLILIRKISHISSKYPRSSSIISKIPLR